MQLQCQKLVTARKEEVREETDWEASPSSLEMPDGHKKRKEDR